MGSTVLFSASDGNTGNFELWASDGTEAGTSLLKDIKPGDQGSFPNSFTVIGSTAYFVAQTNNRGSELYKTDGTAAGTVLVKDIETPFGAGSFPEGLVAVGGTLYFSAFTSANGTELWKSDGTEAGTVRVKDINAGSGSSSPTGMTAVGSTLFFSANNGTSGVEVWKSDGTDAGTTLVKDVSTGTGSSNPTGFAPLGTDVYFSASDGATAPASGTELWRSDGTAAGTVLVKDLNPGTASSSPQLLTPALGTLFFSASDGTTGGGHGIEPYVLRVNDAPVAAGDAYSARVDSPRTVAAPGVLANDSDADGDVLTASLAGPPANGTVSLNADGSFVYTPSTGFGGTDTFTYLATDLAGTTGTATVTMTVAGVNAAPTAGADAYSTNEDTPLTVAAPGVTANDADGDGDALTSGSASTPANGTVALGGSGSFTYTPSANFHGSDSFTYVVTDSFGGAATGTVTITVHPVNDAPVAGVDSYSTDADTPLTVPPAGVLANDTDVDGDSLVAGSAGMPLHGSVTLSADGSFSYTPPAGFAGIDSFTYVVSDGTGGTATGTVYLNVFGEGSVASVTGSACGYSTNIGLFGGALNPNGCLRPVPSTDRTYSPSVTLPSTGSPTPITAFDAGAMAMLGPGPIFGGRWPWDVNAAPESGPISAVTEGTPAAGTVSSAVEISLHPEPHPVQCWQEPAGSTNCLAPGGFGPSPAEGDSLHVECSASNTAVSGSATFVNAEFFGATTSQGEPIEMQPVPDNPPVNYTLHGVLTNVGDVYTVVYNEHVWRPDGSLTVNAVHMYLHGPTAVGEIIKGQVTCGTNPSPAPPADTAPPTCTSHRYSQGFDFGGVFDAHGLQSISNIEITNGTLEVGVNPSSPFDHLRFVPGQTGPLGIRATATNTSLPMQWSYDATDAAGNTRRCRSVEPPVAADDAYATTSGAALTVAAPGVLANDTDGNGDVLTAGSASTPANGSVTMNLDGSFTYTPNAGFVGTDTFTYAVSDGRTGLDGGSDEATVTVTVTQPPPSGPTTLSVDSIIVNEGSAGPTSATFTVTRSGDASGPSTVKYRTSGGTATPGGDYTGVPALTTLSFAAGDTAKTIVIAVAGDTVPEKDETFSLLLSAPTGAVLADVEGTATIRNDDGASFLAVGNVVATEGEAGTTPAMFTVTRSGNTTSSSTATATVKGGTAVSGSDYVAAGATALAFAAGETEKSITVNVIGDAVPEANDTFNLVLSAPSLGTTLADPSGTASIDDDDGTAPAPPSTFLAIDSKMLDEGNGATPATFTVTRYGNTSAATTVSWKTSGGNATAGTDYTAVVAGQVTFGIGETEKTVTLSVIGDTAPEKDETVNVVLFAPPKGSLLADASATATILNDDGASFLAVGNARTTEGDAGTTVVEVTVTRSGTTTSPATVKAKTSGGNATPGTDYATLTDILLEFAAGETTKTVAVTVNGDTSFEPNETFNVVLYAPGPGGTLADASGTTTILNDD